MTVQLPMPAPRAGAGVGAGVGVGVRAGVLADKYGRVATDLRVSVTDRCNLRCTYCMPADGLDWLPKPELLTFEEMTRLVGVAVGLGITDVRLTGGEPLLRRVCRIWWPCWRPSSRAPGWP
jgi:hypothetical protein